MGDDLSLVVALGGGLLSFLSPCILPLVPAYFGSLVGPEVFENEDRRFRLTIFLHALAFVLGFSVLLVGLGALAGLIGFVIPAQSMLKKIAGGLLIVFGVFMLLAIKIPWLNFEKRVSPAQGRKTGYVRSFLIGSIFVLAWTPCVGPIFGGILTLALDSATVLKGAFLLAVYSLGLAIPFLVVGLAFDFLKPLMKQLKKRANVIYLISGLLLIAAGILNLTPIRLW
jgi:cytochrome c-type biogenesis protein